MLAAASRRRRPPRPVHPGPGLRARRGRHPGAPESARCAIETGRRPRPAVKLVRVPERGRTRLKVRASRSANVCKCGSNWSARGHLVPRRLPGCRFHSHGPVARVPAGFHVDRVGSVGNAWRSADKPGNQVEPRCRAVGAAREQAAEKWKRSSSIASWERGGGGRAHFQSRLTSLGHFFWLRSCVRLPLTSSPGRWRSGTPCPCGRGGP